MDLGIRASFSLHYNSQSGYKISCEGEMDQAAGALCSRAGGWERDWAGGTEVAGGGRGWNRSFSPYVFILRI